MTLGWRPHDLNIAYIPFIHGYGSEAARSDPVFMAKHNRQPQTHHHLPFPYDADRVDSKYIDGDAETAENVYLGMNWLREANSGLYRSWEDLRFLRENWEGPLVLKGIQHVKVSPHLSLSYSHI